MIIRLLIVLSLITILNLSAQVQKPDYIQSTGFFTVNGKIYNGDGTEFIMRGVNHNHFWGNEEFNLKSIEGIANTPANCVRVVMSDQDWTHQSSTPAKKRMLVETYISKGMVPMVELHDGTCEKEPFYIENMVDSWTLPENVAWFNEYEEYVILNIANEWGPGDTDADWRVWRDTYKQAITDIRDAGINNMIVIDSPKCGQGPRAMQVYGQELLDHDPQHNVVFSIHMYGWWRSMSRADEVNAPNSDSPPWLAEWELQTMLDLGLPVIVGEFSWTEFESVNYDTQELIAFCEEKGIGWLAWSWNGNGNDLLDMAKGWMYESDEDLKPYGDLIVNHPRYGLRATAEQATAFGPPNQRPEVTITSPTENQAIEMGDPVTIEVEASDSDGQVTRVEFYVNDEKIGEDDAAPYVFEWPNAPRGKFQLYAVAWDDSAHVKASEIVELRIGYRSVTNEAALVVGSVELPASDAAIKERLEMLGYAITLVDDNEASAEQVADRDLLVISSTVVPTRVRTTYTDVEIPIVVWDTQLFDDLGMSGNRFNTDYGHEDLDAVQIVNADHPAAGGLEGTPTVYRQAERIGWAIPQPDADIIASIPGEPEKATLFVYERGDALVDMPAPAPRIGLFFQNDAGEISTIEGWMLFDAAVDYAENTTVAVETDSDSEVPTRFALAQNYPNPFNPTTQIAFDLPQAGHVTVKIFNTSGQLVCTLTDRYFGAGRHTLSWNGMDDTGTVVGNGVYFYQWNVNTEESSLQRTKKMMLLR